MNNVLSITSISVARRLAMYLLLAGLFFVASSKAQNNRTIWVEKAKMNYIKAMNTENEALKESAIFNAMALEQYYPDNDYTSLIEKLNALSVNSENPKIRYKALLAYNFFTNNAWFGDFKFIRQQQPEMIFRSIADTVNEHLLSLSQN